MALQFVWGSAGSGKSTYLYEHILKLAKENPRQIFFIVVPEQFTMQTQRELVSRQENHAIMNIDVVSFQRLAYRVFDELGMTGVQVLEETGKNFVLRKVAEEKQHELKILQGSMKRAGYINEIKSIISELAQYRIGVEALKELEEDETLSLPFRYRLQDIRTMYDGFLDYLQGNYITSEELLELFAQEAERSAILKDCVLVLDGFTGFTPVQYALLERLMEFAKDIYVSLTMDSREDAFSCEGMQDVFYMSKKTIHALSEIARKIRVEIAEPIILGHSDKSRFKVAPPLEWLEQNLFRKEIAKCRDERVKEHIFLYSLPEPRQELLFVAGEMKRLLQEEKYRYQDMAIVCGDVELYSNYVPEIFADFQIPYFIDKKKNISYHPMTEMIKEVLNVVEYDFSYESIMAYLRCGFSGISREEIDLVENYILANKIRGFEAYRVKWVRLRGVKNTEELEEVNRIRQILLAQFQEQREIWKDKERTVLDKTVALYQFIVSLEVHKQIETRRIYLEKDGQLALAKEYEQIYRIVMDLLDKMAELLPNEKMPLSEYREILEAGFSASSVGIIPPGYDRVLVGDIERTRLPDIKVLFLVGVNDGLIPKAEKQGGLISQKERQIFEEHDMELAPGIREKSFIQKFYLYLNLTKPSEKLYLTSFRMSADGKESRKSYLLGVMQRIFPELVVQKMEGIQSYEQYVTPKSSQRFLIEGIHQAKNGNAGTEFLALLQWYRSQPYWNEKVEEFLDAAYYSYVPENISRTTAKELYGNVLENSVTRLERFAKCAYAHFMAYGIGVKERSLGEFAAVDMGSLFHNALEQYAIAMEKAGYHWLDVPATLQESLVEQAVTSTVEEAGYLVYQDARTAYMIQRIMRILKKTVATIGQQVKESTFSPEGYEVKFEETDSLEAVNFQLSAEERMHLQGRIDRIDTKKEEDRIYVKVIDYKSGNTQFSLVSLYQGVQLQLVVYMNAATELMRNKYPQKEIVPMGMFYYHIDDPVIDGKPNITEEEIRKKVFEQLKLDGIALEMEDDSVAKKSKRAENKDLKLLSDFVNKKIRQIGHAIYDGEIGAFPYSQKEKTGCDYCPYRGICGFDKKLPGYEYRKTEEENDTDSILEKMRKEVDAEDGIHERTTASH